MHTLTLPAPAKINLFLHVLGRRPDGYHNIQTVFQFVSLSDELNFQLREDGKINLNPELFGVVDAHNLIVRAAKALQKASGCTLGADITLTKNIPVGAGLGGGSSDAATTLLALNKLWKTKYSLHELTELGAPLGADVPVFVQGHAAWGEGRGDELIPIILPEHWYLLVIPKCSVSTEKLFQDPRLTRDSAALTISTYQPGQGHNDFTDVVCQDYREVAEAMAWLNQYAEAKMTGSGGVCFAEFDTQEKAGKIAALAPDTFSTEVVKGLNHSPVLTALGER